MIAVFYLSIQGVKKPGRKTELGGIKAYKTKPSVGSSEISVKVSIEIPDSLFERPTLEAKFVIPDSAEIAPHITTELADNITQAIKDVTGVTVRLSGIED